MYWASSCFRRAFSRSASVALKRFLKKPAIPLDALNAKVCTGRTTTPTAFSSQGMVRELAEKNASTKSSTIAITIISTGLFEKDFFKARTSEGTNL